MSFTMRLDTIFTPSTNQSMRSAKMLPRIGAVSCMRISYESTIGISIRSCTSLRESCRQLRKNYGEGKAGQLLVNAAHCPRPGVLALSVERPYTVRLLPGRCVTVSFDVRYTISCEVCECRHPF